MKKTEVIRFRVHRREKQLLKEVAENNEMSLSEFIMSVLRKYFEPKPKTK